MKKFLSVVLAFAVLAAMLAACGNGETEETGTAQETASTGSAPIVEDSMETLLNKVIEERPVEFAGDVYVLDLSDTSEHGLWALKSYTGLDNADGIADAAAYEPLMNAMAFSMVMVRLESGADSRIVAEAMKAGIDTRKWICVEADDLLVAGFGDVVMLIMVDSTSDMTAQSFVDACQKVVGMEPAFVI